MGAWGTGSFENDGAADLAGELADGGGIDLLDAACDAVLDVGEDYLEAPPAETGVAAADLVARLADPDADHPPIDGDLEAWVEAVRARPPRRLVEKARRCIRRVLTEPSELLELWADSDDFDDWKTNLEGILGRL